MTGLLESAKVSRVGIIGELVIVEVTVAVIVEAAKRPAKSSAK
ncbi:MAG TPA: hypothetical protein VK503_04370 [Candidatus Bathyarchaeia archaeon]|nr:hypothetical protein [Candidatus Bathyarchaeia archaeon]